MTPDWVHDLIVSAPPTLAALGVWFQGRSTHKTFNSKMDAMHELVRRSAYAEGVKAQKEAQQSEEKD